VNAIVLFQLFNALCARAELRTVFHRDTLTNPRLWLALGGVLVLQLAAVHWGPVQDLFGTVSLGVRDWVVCVAVASSVLWVDEIRKAIVRARHAGSPG
jgi:Ca2+-transporting ATPase